MFEFFSLSFSGPAFVSLGWAHVRALLVIVWLNIALATSSKASRGTHRHIRIGLAVGLWLAEASWQVWNVAMGTWKVQTMLPVNFCSALIWLCGIMLLRRNYAIYEFAYFLGIGGALQYLATPDLGPYGFPHFRFFQTFASHGLLLTAPIYMTLAEGFRPTWRSLRRVVVVANIYVLAVFALNSVLGSNYLMLSSKPATPSLLDVLPDWPYYIAGMELIGLLSCLVLYLPFILVDRNRGLRMPAN
jgi:hypothetical integral membrane protein (TIGR02206 family)